jgi:hypothetical protein
MEFFLILLLAFPTSAFAAEPITLDTPKGTFHGEIFNGARLFPYIAYAEAPIGKYRWRKVPLVENARQRGIPVQCVQTGDDTFNGGNFPQTEDCLYMNVWAPKAGDKHPVILLIHGGGLSSGNGVQKFYDGSVFTEKGVVFVAFNYRLGELGYGANLEKNSASLGLLDQANALNWVIRNISYFGGDPENIYLMGHSKGAEAVTALLETGLAPANVKGAIAMSLPKHFDWDSNDSFDKIQTRLLPGELNMSAEKVMRLKPQVGVYIPVISSVRRSGEGKHRFQLLSTVLYDERFWGKPSDLLCSVAEEMPKYFDYIDTYFFVLHAGKYDHGDDVYELFAGSKFGKSFRDYIVRFIHEGRPPRLTFGIRPKPYRGSLQMSHLYPWFSLSGTFPNKWKSDVVCDLPAPGSAINGYWYNFERILNFFGYGNLAVDYTPNLVLKKDPGY